MHARKRLVLSAAAVLVAGYFASGVYVVRPDERAVVRILGRAPETHRRIPPGINYAWPWPLSRVDCPKTTEVRRVYVGLTPAQRDSIQTQGLEAIEASLPSDVLTGDVNILKATLVVQYQVADPAQYLFGAADPDRLVQSVVQAVLIEALAGLPVDEALTTAKTTIQLEVLQQAQAILDEYESGVRLGATHLEAIDPPQAIIAVFQDVVGAKKDGERAVENAMAESNRTLSRARGEAAQVREEALAYQQSRVSRARGEAARFLSVLPEYRRNPAVYERRLLLQTFEAVLPNLRTYILDTAPGEPASRVRIIGAGPP
jgi:membrane protease subunit HflK